MNLGKGANIPTWAFSRPVLIIDSGQSADESVFLESYRKFLWNYHALHSDRTVRHMWMLYPNESHPERYGSRPVNEYDQWEVRPIRRNGKPLYSGGILHTVAAFEDGCLRLGIKAPWREFNKDNRRAAVIYLNPTSRDIRFIQKHWRNFKKAYNIPDFFIGQSSTGKMPLGVGTWAEGIMVYDKGSKKHYKSRIDKFHVEEVGQKNFWNKMEHPRRRVAFASNWGHALRQRSHGVPQKWFHDWGYNTHVPEADRWQDVVDATDSEYYMVYSRRESIPFDAMRAISRGATLIAPDIKLYRRLPGKKVLYPARDCGHGQIAFSTTDVRLWLQNKFK